MGIEHKTACVEGAAEAQACLGSVRVLRGREQNLHIRGVGRGGVCVGEETPTSNKLISVNAMFIKFLG